MGRYSYSHKRVVYKNNKIQCQCGGHYTDATYQGSYANIDPQTKHEQTKMHQTFVANGNKMDKKVEARLIVAAAKAKEERDEALANKRANQTLCGF